MNPAQLLSHFDGISEAPDAIPRLRRFILDLAVRGKLVEQDPRDEPASELFKRIQLEKMRLVKAGMIKKLKHLVITATVKEIYEIPSNWKLVPLGETVNTHLGGGTPPKNNSNYWNGDILWASVKDIGKGKYIDETIDRITEAGLADSSSNLIPPGNLIVVTRMGLGKVSINRVPIAINQDLRALSLSSLVSIDYHYIFFKTHGFEGTGLTVKGIKLDKLLNIPFPLPPLAEQHRIVAKVDELMGLCDRLELVKTERESQRDRLVASSLHHLNNGSDADSFRESAHFYFNHLPRLTTRLDHIQQLRQTILNLAVRGKLVPQDITDEPASALLGKIAKKKERLIEEGTIKKTNPLPEITDVEKPFELPRGWKWCRVWDVAKLITSGSRDWARYYSEKGAIFVTMGNLSRGHYELRMDTIRYVNPPKDSEGFRTKLEENDLLISITGDVGNLGLVPEDFGEAYINQHTCLLRFMPECQNRYFPELMRSSWAKFQFDAPQRGIKNSFRLGDVGEMIIPIPPLAEQLHIVAKVDELMALCDQLETQLTTVQIGSRQLLEATLFHALST